MFSSRAETSTSWRLAGRARLVRGPVEVELQLVPVDVDVVEVVVRPQALELLVRLLHHERVPQPHVVEGVAVGDELARGQRLGRRERPADHVGQTERLPGRVDVALDVGRLEGDLVRRHDEVLDERRVDPADDDGRDDPDRRAR